jgi:hypothetical protein
MLACSLTLLLSFQPQNSPIRTNIAIADEPAPELNLLWQQFVGSPVSLTTSPNGKFISTVDINGTIQCFDASGKLIWKISLPGVDRVAIGPDASAIAYSYLNPLDTATYVITPDGKLLWRHEVFGAIWTAAASNEPGHFAVGTGERYCYIYTIKKRSHRYKRWRIPGVPTSINFTPDNKSIIFGTWQSAGIFSYSMDGSQMIKQAGREDRIPMIDMSPSSKCALVITKPNTNVPKGEIQLDNGRLSRLWKKEFPFYNLTADVTTSGDFVAVGYQRAITHKDKEILENRVELYNRSGKMLWGKGGLFGEWNLLQACNPNRILVYDESCLYVLSQTGNVILKHKLPSSIRRFTRIPARNKIIICCENGQMMVFSIK